MTSTRDHFELAGYRPGTWTVDHARSSVGFSIRQLATRVRGQFRTYDATIVIAERPQDSRVDVSVDVSSIDTGNARRDEHLRRSYLDIEARECAIYRSRGLRQGDEGLVIEGVLTLNGVQRDVPLALELPTSAGASGTGPAEIRATTRIRRRDFRIAAPLGFAGGLIVSDTIKFDLVICARPVD